MSYSRPTLDRSRRLERAAAAVALSAFVLWAPPAAEADDPSPVAPNPPAAQVGSPPDDADALEGRDSSEGVFVRDSALAVEKLSHAQRMEKQKEWDNAASLYQEVLDKYPDRVVPSKVGKDGKIIQYTSVATRVREQLSKWPAEGRQVYRNRYDVAAQAMLDAAGENDVNALNRLVSNYFITDAAKAAAQRLVEIDLESGEFLAAARIADDLIERFPKEDLQVERPGLLFRAALAYQLGGDAEKAKLRLATLRADHPDTVGLVRGKETNLVQSLETELKANPAASTVVASADSWPMFHGDPARSRVSKATGKPGAKLYSIDFGGAAAAPDRMPGQARTVIEQQMGVDADQALGVIPAIDRGELYFQDGQQVGAVALDSGVPLSGWMQTYGVERQGRYMAPGVNAPTRGLQTTLTLTDDAVLAVMGGADRATINSGMINVAESRLTCLDRRTGKEKWTAILSQLPDEAAEVRQMQLGGSPLVVGDNVLCIARGARQQQFEECWVVCFDRITGRHRWSCYIASANNLAMMNGVGGMVGAMNGPDGVSHLAYADGRVYALSNLGAIAAIDAYNGSVVWLNLYPSGRPMMAANGRFDPFMQTRRMGTRLEPSKPWAVDPVVVRDGRVFVLPSEGKFLFIYDAATGAEIKRISKEHLENADTLLGVVGNKLVVVGGEFVVCMDWQKYDPQKYDPDNDPALLWRSARMIDGPRGRSFLTSDSVWTPGAERIVRIDLNGSGSILEEYPTEHKPWGEGEGPGNVLVTSDHVVIAGASSIDVYTDLNAARKRLDAEVAAAPGDPAPLLRYAEVMFVSGQPADAVTKLDASIKALGGLNSMRVGPSRDRVFADALTFAQKMALDERPERKRMATELFDRAAAAAATPGQQVQYRLSRGRFAEAEKDAATATRLYQEILSDPALRVEPRLDDASGEPTQAHAVAEKQIQSLISRVGRTVYAPFDQEAAEAMKKASAAADGKPDAEALSAVAQTYPLSDVAPVALMAAADAYEAAGNARQAIQSLRQLYFRKSPQPGTVDAALVLESMARNYLSLPNRTDVAAARLAQAALLRADAKLQKPMKLPDGKQLAQGLALADALKEIRGYRGEEQTKKLPDFHLPRPPTPDQAEAWKAAIKSWPKPFLPESQADLIANVSMLAPALRDFARPDRLVASSSDGSLSIFRALEPQPIGKSTALAEPPRGSAWIGSDVLVWGAGRLALLPETGGDAKWTVAVDKLEALRIVRPTAAAPEAADANDAADGNLIRNLRGQQLIIRDFAPQRFNRVAGGGGVAVNPQAERRAGPEQVVDVRPCGDRILFATTAGRLVSLDAATGKIAWQTRLSDHALDRWVASDEFTVVKVSDDTQAQLIALDSYTGQFRGTKAFSIQGGATPVNMALAADGTLVYTLPDRLVLKDLYKPWNEPERQVTGQPGQTPYAGATEPDQLVIAEGRVLALADDGQQAEKFVRIHSLETGLPQTLPLVEAGNAVERRLTTGTKNWDATLRVVGPRLYVFNPRTVRCYNLDRPDETWEGVFSEDEAPQIKEAFIGQQYVVLLDASPNPDIKTPSQRLLAFGRYAASSKDNRESGRRDYQPAVADASGITGWQAVEGGFYYLSGDGKLHLLRGAAK